MKMFWHTYNGGGEELHLLPDTQEDKAELDLQAIGYAFTHLDDVGVLKLSRLMKATPLGQEWPITLHPFPVREGMQAVPGKSIEVLPSPHGQATEIQC